MYRSASGFDNFSVDVVPADQLEVHSKQVDVVCKGDTAVLCHRVLLMSGGETGVEFILRRDG